MLHIDDEVAEMMGLEAATTDPVNSLACNPFARDTSLSDRWFTGWLQGHDVLQAVGLIRVTVQ